MSYYSHSTQEYVRGAATDPEIDHHDERMARPWTMDEFERLRQTVEAMLRTHMSIDLPDGRILSGFDGRAWWAVLGALGRDGVGT